MTSTASPRVMWIVGFPGVTIDGVRFVNCTFRGLEAPEVMNSAARVSFESVTVEPAKRGRSINPMSISGEFRAPLKAHALARRFRIVKGVVIRQKKTEWQGNLYLER